MAHGPRRDYVRTGWLIACCAAPSWLRGRCWSPLCSALRFRARDENAGLHPRPRHSVPGTNEMSRIGKVSRGATREPIVNHRIRIPRRCRRLLGRSRTARQAPDPPGTSRERKAGRSQRRLVRQPRSAVRCLCLPNISLFCLPTSASDKAPPSKESVRASPCFLVALVVYLRAGLLTRV